MVLFGYHTDEGTVWYIPNWVAIRTDKDAFEQELRERGACCLSDRFPSSDEKLRNVLLCFLRKYKEDCPNCYEFLTECELELMKKSRCGKGQYLIKIP